MDSKGYVKLFRSTSNGDFENDVMLLGIWSWILLNVNRFEMTLKVNGEPVKFPAGSVAINVRKLSERIGIHRETLRKKLDYLRRRGSIQLSTSHEGTVISVINWSSYQESDAPLPTKLDPSVGQAPANPVPLQELRIKNNTKYSSAEVASPASCGPVEPLSCEGTKDALAKVKQSVQERWLAAYPDAQWVKQEILKALAWEAANPKKRSKDFGRFMTNWLSNGWERYRKSLPSANGINITPIRLEDIK